MKPTSYSVRSYVAPTTVSPIKDVRARPAEHGGQSVHTFGRHLNRNASTNGQAAMRPSAHRKAHRHRSDAKHIAVLNASVVRDGLVVHTDFTDLGAIALVVSGRSLEDQPDSV